MKTTLRIFFIFLSVATGGVFLYSAYTKLMPIESFEYTMVEFLHIPLIAAAIVARLFIGLEIGLGSLLILHLWGKGKWVLKAAFALLAAFSIYLIALWIKDGNNVNCGCFGDAIVLTPWQSFSKDLVLLVLIIVLFKNRAKIHPLFTAKTSDRLLIVAIVLSFGVSFYTYNFLPVFDFLAYKVGANIPDEMKTPPGAMPDEYEQTYNLKNKKTGATKVMTDKEYMKTGIWKDNDWVVVGDPVSRLVKKGLTPKIQDLTIQDAQRNDYTKELLSSPYYSLFVVADDVSQTDPAAIDKINAICINLTQNFNIRTILLTSSSAPDAQAFAKQHHLISEIFYADGVPIKEMVRANPGVMLIKNGTIINKWHYHTVPSYDELVSQYLKK